MKYILLIILVMISNSYAGRTKISKFTPVPDTLYRTGEHCKCDHIESEPNGGFIREVPYKDQLINGTVKVYDQSGKLLISIPYYNNNIHGELIMYDGNGHPSLIIRYQLGILVEK